MSRIVQGSLILLISLVFHAAIWASGVLPFFDFQVFDLISQAGPGNLALQQSDVVVVEIDEASLAQYGQWPWPRLILALMTAHILQQQPAVVGMDIVFPEADRTSPVEMADFYKTNLGLDFPLSGIPESLLDNDQVFARALQAGPTVLPLFLSPGSAIPFAGQCDLTPYVISDLPGALDLPKELNVLCSLPVLQKAAAGSGFINASVDNDGTFRREPLLTLVGQQQVIPSLVLAMLLQLDPQLDVSLPGWPWQPVTVTFADKSFTTNQHGEVFIPNFSRDIFKRVSVSQVLSGQVASDLFTGKMVLVGASATGLYDQYITASGTLVPGVFIHAALLENLLQGGGIYQSDFSAKAALAFSFIFSLLIVWLVFERNYLQAWICFIIVSGGACLLTLGMLFQGSYLSLGYFLLPFVGLFALISLFFAVLHHIERQRFLEDLGAAHCATIDSMTMVAESRDVETGSHIIRTKEYVALLARTLAAKGLFKKELTPHSIDLMYRAASLHDIGKVGVPDAILRKPGHLDAEEFKIMQRHVEIGRAIINNASNSYSRTNDFLTLAANICYSHHEKWDGSGYPQGLAGDAIPLEGRLMALADVYDALVSSRCYKQALAFEEARDIIVAEKGRHFDPLLIDIFLEVQDRFAEIAGCYEDATTFVDSSYLSGWPAYEDLSATQGDRSKSKVYH